LAVAKELIAPRTLNLPSQVQISLNIPPYHHRPGGGHLDGLTPPEPSGRPGTFTCLAGIFLSDQRSRDMGNLWVWPGSHRVIPRYLRQNGPDALLDIVHPDLGFDPPEQVVGSAGDLLLAHYLLAHNMGGNTSATTRRVVYFRLRSTDHVAHWREYVQDELFEFERCRALPGTGQSFAGPRGWKSP
jgi:hypothetical protein